MARYVVALEPKVGVLLGRVLPALRGRVGVENEEEIFWAETFALSGFEVCDREFSPSQGLKRFATKGLRGMRKVKC